MIGRPGRVGVVLGNPKVGLVDMVQQPVEHVRRFAHRRGNDPSMERTVTAGDVRVDHRAGVDAIYFALTEPPAPARPPARKYCPSEDEVVRRALGPARATPPAGPSTRGRHGRRVEARPPVALLERRAAHHGADQQRGRGVPVGHREHRHDHPGRADDDADGWGLRRVRARDDPRADIGGTSRRQGGGAYRRAAEETR